jgi:hypothetical protein
MKSRDDVPTPHTPPPNTEPDFAHQDGDEVLHCPGGKLHHAQAVLAVYGKKLTSPHSAQLCRNIDQ